jgi:hypothetical protein
MRRLDAQLDRIRRLFELGEYDEETFLLKRSEIRAEQERLREQATALEGQDDAAWCRVQLFDLLAVWDASDGAERTKLLGGLFERIEAHIVEPETFARKFYVKREAEAIARRLGENGYAVEWVRRNYGAQGRLTWSIRLSDGSEIHNTRQLDDMGIGVAKGDGPAVAGVNVVAVPREGWRRFFEYAALERETGFEPATSTLASRSSISTRITGRF